MEALLRFDTIYLMIPGAIALVTAIILLILRRKKNGVRPPYAKAMLKAAIPLIIFAVTVLAVIPVICYAVLFLKFGAAIFYSGLK